ncbi:phosphotransferase [Alkaliphilus hydrothermalis]|uniref:Aminoglycoside phosphotransferase domain-containing protein n=1 Tax=Alkaliphilus hydrothermalis TaxID=1482730 RepID=A0ABS2NLL5_9FIRM|nr:phosphotransferase [Alkaliphilus hydrothermalis]MBM7613819.1 hypothetical protein [Alkaliphilus hydrothermalis]
MEQIFRELEKLGLSNNHFNIKEIRQQNGVYLYRVKENHQFYVLKYFEKEEFRREIKNYALLQKLNIPTIKVLSSTEFSLLLEDLEESKDYRLGIADDLDNKDVAKALARWYIQLHDEGTKYINENGCHFYREIDAINKENIQLLMEQSNTQGLKVWDLILDHFDVLWDKINSMEETLTYNDFYWTNFAVGHDGNKALMFDYNFLGAGFRYNDIRNVCSSLSKEACEAFIKEYGGINEAEKIIDDATCILFDLIAAYQKPTFPSWAKTSLESIDNGDLERAFLRILEL